MLWKTLGGWGGLIAFYMFQEADFPLLCHFQRLRPEILPLLTKLLNHLTD